MQTNVGGANKSAIQDTVIRYYNFVDIKAELIEQAAPEALVLFHP